MKRAFTLIELLVVLAVMALLSAILVPSLARARDAARSVACLSNLRQMGMAATTYVAGNSNHFPSAYITSFAPTAFTSANWDFTVTTTFSPPATNITPGLLWQGSGNMKVQQCPAYVAASADPYTGYNYNTSYVGRGSGESVTDPASILDLTHPQTTALFGDGQYAGGTNKFMRSPFASPYDGSFAGRSAGTQGFRHQGKTNILFADDHGEPLSTPFTTTYSFDQPNIAPGTGFLSADNALYQLN